MGKYEIPKRDGEGFEENKAREKKARLLSRFLRRLMRLYEKTVLRPRLLLAGVLRRIRI